MPQELERADGRETEQEATSNPPELGSAFCGKPTLLFCFSTLGASYLLIPMAVALFRSKKSKAVRRPAKARATLRKRTGKTTKVIDPEDLKLVADVNEAIERYRAAG